jgi:prepilin-type N-terminal cleavage/methylation domain-containing protein
MKKLIRHRSASRGFTLIEVLVVIGIMGILMTVSYPSIMNTMASRNLDNATREIQTFMQQTKLQAVSTRIAHRVHFYQPEGTSWAYEMERMQADLSVSPSVITWVRAQRGPTKTISNRFNVTITLPVDAVSKDPVAIFSALGMFPEFVANQNSITLQSPKLDRPGQDDERVLSIFMGGSIQYAKRKSS